MCLMTRFMMPGVIQLVKVYQRKRKSHAVIQNHIKMYVALLTSLHSNWIKHNMQFGLLFGHMDQLWAIYHRQSKFSHATRSITVTEEPHCNVPVSIQSSFCWRRFKWESSLNRYQTKTLLPLLIFPAEMIHAKLYAPSCSVIDWKQAKGWTYLTIA